LFEQDKQGRSQGYRLPWKGFPEEAELQLKQVVISFKNRIRVINKTINYYQKYVRQADGNYQKKFVKQKPNINHWALRRAFSKDTFYGIVKLRNESPIDVHDALEKPHLIVDPLLRKKATEIFEKFNGDLFAIKNYLKKKPLSKKGEIIKSVLIFEEFIGMKVDINDGLSEKDLNNIIDGKLRKDLKQHLREYDGDYSEAFSQNGIIEFNENRNIPLKSVKKKKGLGKKFPVGDSGVKKYQLVTTAEETNLFFNIYANVKYGKRSYETIPLKEVIDHQKVYAGKTGKYENSRFPVQESKGKYIFTLSPMNLVYVPTYEQALNPKIVSINEVISFANRIYRVEKFTGTACYFLPQHVSSLIREKPGKHKQREKGEFESQGKSQRNIEDIFIKKVCWKLEVDKLGQIKNVIKAPVEISEYKSDKK